jgi:hypothetical protein
MNKKIIEHNLNFYILEQDLFEPDEIFQYRIKYILENLEKDGFENLIKKSRLTANEKFWGCVYKDRQR